MLLLVFLVGSANSFGTRQRDLNMAWTSRRAMMAGSITPIFAPIIAQASGAGPEEAAKYAEKYRVKSSVCTPTTPQNCNESYAKSLDPRRGLSPEQLAARDKRNDAERANLRKMLESSK
mmetsp:Transcript_640/g.817  ORF Transcript_640/g.817 Transcript_640/m.817 type:complete len:119 (-) Transcript_640:85-441(-)